MWARAFILALVVLASGCATPDKGPRSGDNGDGTYTNPPLFADFPDPDIIRVGEDFYFATTTFANAPGLTILHSKDLVSWSYAAHVMPRLEGRPTFDLQNGGAYRKGVFAPSLRRHAGVFYLAVTPVGHKTRIYYSTDIKGPWRYHELDREAFDPALFFEEDGRGFLVTSGGWDGTVTLLSLSADYSSVVSAQSIHFNKGAEGSKIIKRGDFYYMFNAIPSRLGLTVSRAKSLFGPWETRNQIDDTTGGHQGALVDLPDGGWYGFVMLDAGSIGRVTNISPVFWEDNWPVWGTADAPGRVPRTAPKPIASRGSVLLPTSDSFNAPQLGMQWQWNHNPDDLRWSLTERPGRLRLNATQAPEFWLARNTLTQKAHAPFSRGEVKLDVRRVRRGDACGFGALGKFSAYIAAGRDEDDRIALQMVVIEDTTQGRKVEVRSADVALRTKAVLHLRTDLDFQSDTGVLSYSEDGRHWTPLGGTFKLMFDWRTGTFQGQQFALFCYNPGANGGGVDVDRFSFSRIR